MQSIGGGMFRKKILIPYSFSQRDEKSIHYAIKNYAGDNTIFLSILYLHAPIPKVGTFTLGRENLIKKMGKEIIDFRQKEDELFKVKEQFLENNFNSDQVEILFLEKKNSVAKDIVEIVTQGKFTTIVLNRSPGKRIATFSESVSLKIISSLKGREIIILT